VWATTPPFFVGQEIADSLELSAIIRPERLPPPNGATDQTRLASSGGVAVRFIPVSKLRLDT
jgi:hypothetical protein